MLDLNETKDTVVIPEPSIGRIVHYVSPGEEGYINPTHLPAIIVSLEDSPLDHSVVNLVVFCDGSKSAPFNDPWAKEVVYVRKAPYSEKPIPHSWHYPERA